MNPLEASILEDERKLKEMMGEDNENDTSASAVDAEYEEEGSQREGDDSGRDDGEQGDSEERTQDGSREAPDSGEKSAEKVEEPPKDASAWAKSRIELREAKAKLAMLEAQRQPEIKQEQRSEVNSGEPNKNEDYQGWLEWKLEKQEQEMNAISGWRQKQEQETQHDRLYSSAIDELKGYVNEFKKKQPDFEDAANHIASELTRSFKVLNPEWSDKKVEAEVTKRLVTEAAISASKGIDPAEQLYDLAYARFGYSKKEETKQQVKKVDLKQIDNNRKRSGSPLQGGGRGAQTLSIEAVENMTNAEFSRLTPSQLAELERMGV